MIELKENQVKRISLKIKTGVIDAEEANVSDEQVAELLCELLSGEELDEKKIEDALGSESQSEIELCTEAVISLNKDKCVEISYMENEDDEQLKTHSRIIFPTENPELVVMNKEGAMSAFLSFEQGKTHICTYETPFMPIKVYVYANLVDNRLLCDGQLRLNYILNLNDTAPQHFAVDVKIKEQPADPLSEFFT